jgi:hypothetical protein
MRFGGDGKKVDVFDSGEGDMREVDGEYEVEMVVVPSESVVVIPSVVLLLFMLLLSFSSGDRGCFLRERRVSMTKTLAFGRDSDTNTDSRRCPILV